MREKKIENKGSSLYQSRLSFRPLLSSTGLGWKGLVVERYQAPPCELPDLPLTHHIVELASQQHVSLGERPDWRGQLRPFSKYPGTCNCFPAGVRPKLRSFTQTNEPPRDSRRLHNLRGWSNGKVSQIFSRGARAGGEDAQGA